ncbi:hypothetical protein DS745_03355 [Anaerobacillus alkaliphilus]|uniref:Uncharacterized protein n=1 Tax=Anaerobacillus alkaliphilus TaxID=1548597 RepID=A0A4Q0VZ77_9BACI|nr:hypothetical protein [Anaerobacillus alkaliphilus]RXJ04436.1 hypothetical protein DS745_03355 [Anaerobacillus alkaliphilus]
MGFVVAIGVVIIAITCLSIDGKLRKNNEHNIFSSSIIEKKLKSIEEQNKRVIEILEEIRDKK